MNERMLLSEEEMDYLVELLNIGAGNAATALTHLLRCTVNMVLPGVDVLPALGVPAVLGDPSAPVACVRMKMIGDLTGCLFFVVPYAQKSKLAALAEGSLLGPHQADANADHSLATLTEVGNILAGVYLTAIHDFCNLNVCHSVPVLAVDMMQALLDESVAARPSDDRTVILIKNEFLIGADRARTYFLIFPSGDSIAALVGSIKEAVKLYGAE